MDNIQGKLAEIKGILCQGKYLDAKENIMDM